MKKTKLFYQLNTFNEGQFFRIIITLRRATVTPGHIDIDSYGDVKFKCSFGHEYGDWFAHNIELGISFNPDRYTMLKTAAKIAKEWDETSERSAMCLLEVLRKNNIQPLFSGVNKRDGMNNWYCYATEHLEKRFCEVYRIKDKNLWMHSLCNDEKEAFRTVKANWNRVEKEMFEYRFYDLDKSGVIEHFNHIESIQNLRKS